ncbi:MAG TPA: hypothetical protein VLE47_04360 [Candidatus Saccharimonadales bacterium]|nr:hypothetical protein [Candidatus Saccharimonadales bacterium]
MQINLVGNQINEIFNQAKSVLVVLGNGADSDLACLSASLVEVFSAYKKGSYMLTNQQLPIAAQPLVKNELLKRHLTPESLVLSFDWTKSQLDRVSYKIEGDRFDLIINSKGKKINPSEISYSYQGEKYDLVISVGVTSLEELTAFGIDQDLFNRVPSINFDKKVSNTQFAKLNLISNSADSICALAANSFNEAKIALPTKAAEIMLVGIKEATKNFTEVADPSTFEAAAYLKRCMIPGMVNFASEKTQGSEDKEETPENWVSPKIFRSRQLS